jgi:hypothetical protein
MALPPSQTRSCNSALAHLGDSRRIASITDPTPLAKTFLAVWDEAIDEVLADHPWNPALARADLAVSADFVPEGSQFSQAFEKPADFLRWLPPRRGADDYFEGEEEGDYILSNEAAPITIRYIRRLDNLTKWSPGMLASLAAKLARKTARAITGSSGMMDRMEIVYQKALSDAKRQDGLATGDRRRHLNVQSTWLGARNRPGGRGCGFRIRPSGDEDPGDLAGLLE